MNRTQSYYSLRIVKNLVTDGHYEITTGARKTAKDCFGWYEEDILKAIMKLQRKHFHKSYNKYDNPSVYVDYYKAFGLIGENVYIHFRIEDDTLYICSFKEI